MKYRINKGLYFVHSRLSLCYRLHASITCACMLLCMQYLTLLNGNREGDEHTQNLGTGPTRLAERPFAEVEMGRAYAYGDKAPDADLCRSHRIASGRLKCQISLRSRRTVPARAEGKLKLDQVPSVCGDGAIGLLLRDRHVGRRSLPDHAIAETAVSDAVTVHGGLCGGTCLR